MQSTEKYKLWLPVMLVLAVSIVMCPANVFAETRSTTTKGTATLVYWGDNGKNLGLPIPFFISMEVTTQATFTMKFDSRLRKAITHVSKTDQSVLLKGARNIPCGIDMSVSTKVYENRKSLYRTMKRNSTGSKNGSYLVNSTSLISGFVNTNAFSLYNPRLETVGSVAGWECTGHKTLTNRLDLP